LWGSEVIAATLEPLWWDHIWTLHQRVCAIFGLQSTLFTVFAVCVANDVNVGDGQTSPLLTLVHGAIISCSAISLILEALEHRGQKGFKALFANGFDLCDSFGALLTAGCAIAHMTGRADRVALLVSSAGAALLLLVKVVALLRGFSTFANLVMVLVQSALDMRAFAVLLLALLHFSTLIFMLLFSGARDDDESFEDDDQVAGFGGGNLRACGGFFKALLTTFDIAILGNVSPSSFDLSVLPWLSQLVFAGVMVAVMVVALNALIALLGGSFDRVQESKAAKTNQLRARFVVEYLSMLPDKKRREIERASTWTHQLVPLSEYERRLQGGEMSSEWRGKLAAIKSALIANQKAMATKEDIDDLKTMMETQVGVFMAAMHDIRSVTQTTPGARPSADQRVSKLEQQISELDTKLKAVSASAAS